MNNWDVSHVEGYFGEPVNEMHGIPKMAASSKTQTRWQFLARWRCVLVTIILLLLLWLLLMWLLMLMIMMRIVGVPIVHVIFQRNRVAKSRGLFGILEQIEGFPLARSNGCQNGSLVGRQNNDQPPSGLLSVLEEGFPRSADLRLQQPTHVDPPIGVFDATPDNETPQFFHGVHQPRVERRRRFENDGNELRQIIADHPYRVLGIADFLGGGCGWIVWFPFVIVWRRSYYWINLWCFFVCCWCVVLFVISVCFFYSGLWICIPLEPFSGTFCVLVYG
mmetsp:Transcript_9347/g.22695  ORF Transcript_9347/g.22695 Transcript_9347/m.22695 type:complete len:277 (-) Transcript_9347:943-1773(-)